MESEKPNRLLHPKKEAAYLLGISVRALDYLIADKKLSTRRIGKRVLIPATELHRFIRSDHPENVREMPSHQTLANLESGAYSPGTGGTLNWPKK
jgi:excisionase family DNA binding protein